MQLFLFQSFSPTHLYFRLQTLVTIGLYGNRIDDEGTQYLSDALKINRVIYFLLLYLSTSYIHVQFC
jgi:hypothetical protein